ncbi:tRNA pseudouridine(55) synthase TruB [Bifidobacterium psychraerophilum]|jgi:tRNA pseudouridine55 synthase|uniref:tRNA pseudouridine(55) synthase TruB n=1 Tax=Bifidobacterium psychraerophilum TaxID=218140 RepID=UPI0023F4403A|nr:tRNA pseudouridine(55) synthase TruB [Bifidobacterium psychraerophilum]MCI1661188.1 tRNA pseudouridine(55) synthase TruB [Bifidobacterium psychraerophilum]MCI1804060.1 tRNA pseudouridine(55) synthase TruB [Bifidobacterium psychraerophilum]MCI2176579.1 tRNA pseudouridine(55) synthase TruB [Bifidobacterium psychraerophilum]MCI2182325.1 tRNA pseudouridine(55) synthase TruB [Bifidobacterium psychraerophilum]
MMVSKDSRDGAPDSGVLLVDKPQGVTSHDVVAAVRGALHMRRVGHAGTLDPMATGVLIIAFGHATRLLNYVSGHDKSYSATIRLGLGTDTDDAEGRYLDPDACTYSDPLPPVEPLPDLDTLTLEELDGIVQRDFTGEIRQIPSSYSAVKVHGVKAYDLARAGKDVELKARTVTIASCTLSRLRRSIVTLPDGTSRKVVDVDADISCSSGTYIRALARDIGFRLRVGGHLTRLRRSRIGTFDLADARMAEHLVLAERGEREFTNREGERVTRARAVLRNPDRVPELAFDEVQAARLAMPCISVSADQARELRFGRTLPIALKGTAAAIESTDQGRERLCAILAPAKDGNAHPEAVFPLDTRS